MRIRRQVERTFEALSTVLNGCATCSSLLRLLRSCSRSRHGGERCRRDSAHAVAMDEPTWTAAICLQNSQHQPYSHFAVEVPRLQPANAMATYPMMCPG